MAFTHEITVRFHEVDRAGIAFYARAFEYAHVAFEELFLAMDPTWTSVFDGGADSGGWGLPLVHADADFHRPMRLGERLQVGVVVEGLTQRSVTFSFQLSGRDDREPRATVRQVHAAVDLASFKSIAIPEVLRQGLAGLGLIEEAQEE